MSYCSQNEIHNFSFRDCVLNKSVIKDDEIILELDALIVKAKNSQNSNYTDSYAGDSVCRLKGARLLSLFKAGYKYYDANDRLIEEKPDEELKLSQAETEELLKEIYLSEFTKNDDDTYTIVLETISEDLSENTDMYELTVTCDDLTISWERYMNRVENN